jgi:hypothetical protein
MFHHSITVSCLIVFYFVNLFFKILMYSHQPISVADFGWRVNHVKLLIPSYLQNLFFKFRFWGVWGATPRQPPPPLGAPLHITRTFTLQKIFSAFIVARSLLQSHSDSTKLACLLGKIRSNIYSWYVAEKQTYLTIKKPYQVYVKM